MPETSINEYGKSGARERDVGSAPWHAGDRMIDSETKSATVEFASKRTLRVGISRALSRHTGRDGQGRARPGGSPNWR